MQRMNLTHCVLGIAGAAVLLIALGIQLETLVLFGTVLACPLVMVLMMRAMTRDRGHDRDHPELRRPAEREPRP